MNIETFDFALITAGVGMGIVFFALITLSLMMLLIRAVFADRAAGSPAAGKSTGGSAGDSATDTTAEPGPNTLDGSGVPRWALAGAVAYLLAEESQMTPYASPWRRRNDEA